MIHCSALYMKGTLVWSFLIYFFKNTLLQTKQKAYLGAGWSRIPLLLQSLQIMNDDPVAIHFEQILFCKLV